MRIQPLVMLVLLAVVSSFLPDSVVIPGALALSFGLLIYLLIQWAHVFSTSRMKKIKVELVQPLLLASVVSVLSFIIWRYMFTRSAYFFWKKVYWAPVVLGMVDTWFVVFVFMCRKQLEVFSANKEFAESDHR